MIQSVKSFDFETTKSPRHFPWAEGAYAVCCSIAREDGTTRSWLLNHPENKQPQGISIREIKEELYSAKRIIAHNIKFDLLWLLQYGIDISPLKVFCTQVAEYLLRGQRVERGSLTLENLSRQYGISDKIDKVKMFWESGYETDEIPASILVPYCEQDCINALAIYQLQAKKLCENNLQSLATLQFELSKILATIEYNGMLVDHHLVSKYGDDYGQQIRDIDGRILDLLAEGGIDKESFNINSKEQLSAALYGGCIRQEGAEVVEKPRKDGSVRCYTRKCLRDIRLKGLGFRPIDNSEKAKEGVYSTDIETLKSLKCTTTEQRELIKLLIEKSRLSKLKSTYFDGILEKMQSDNRIHPSMNQTITTTGRLSSSNPNGTNMPRGSTGPVKKIFVTRY